MSGVTQLKSYDVDPGLRFLRNIMVLSALFGVLIIVFGTTSIVGLFLVIAGPDKFPQLFQHAFVETVLLLWKFFLSQWEYWWMYKGSLTPTSQNFFVIKLFSLSFLPSLIMLTLVYVFRAPLADFRPFKRMESVHGDAHWATQYEIKKIGLRSKKGMLVGKDKQGYLVAPGYQHTLLFAPTGSGKGVGFVIPNLLFWDESVVVHDIKLENYELTSGWRKKHLKQEVYVWEPANVDGLTHCYNPVDWISKKMGQMVDDVQKLAMLILPKIEFWNNEARSLLVGVLLYLLADKNKIKSFGQVVRELRNDDVVYNFAVVLDTMGKIIHPVAYMNLAAFLQKADKERSGVISTLNSGLELWANPLIDAATARSDFNIQEFKKKPTTVYVGLTPDNIQRLGPLMRIFYQQATEFLSRKMPAKNEPYGVLFLMDEFPTLGKMDQFLNGIAYFRGYHVRLFLIVQDTQQLKGTYEDSGMNSFLSNAMYRITFAANNIETAKLISELCGNRTVQMTSFNKPKYFDMNPASRSIHISQSQRALLLPQEVISLPRDDQIILIEASSPIRTTKIKYFADKNFTGKLWKKIKLPQQEPYIPNRDPPKPAANSSTNNNANPTSSATSGGGNINGDGGANNSSGGGGKPNSNSNGDFSTFGNNDGFYGDSGSYENSGALPPE